MNTVKVIDSHTAGEPTRVVMAGGPDLGSGSLAERRARFRTGHDGFRQSIMLEPRGSDVLVGALLCEPVDPACAAGVIFFNNVDCLNMCGHGTIGVAVTLAHLGRIGPGAHRLETSVGEVSFDLLDQHRVRIHNVPSFRHAAEVEVNTASHGIVTGDIAWGGNWFYIAPSPVPLESGRIPELTAAAWEVRHALEAVGLTGKDNGLIDHIEFSGPAESGGADARNFVLCPGGAYDRSPCGTGTSAKIACLAATGRLAPGETWVQESIIGSRFEASYTLDASGQVMPAVTGSAYIYGETTLLFDPEDPFAGGISL